MWKQVRKQVWKYDVGIIKGSICVLHIVHHKADLILLSLFSLLNDTAKRRRPYYILQSLIKKDVIPPAEG